MEEKEFVKRLSLIEGFEGLEDQKNLILASAKSLSLLEDQKSLVLPSANSLSIFDDHLSTTSKEEVDSDCDSVEAEKLIPLDMVNSEAVLLEHAGFTAFELRVNHLEKSVWGYDPSGNKMKKDYNHLEKSVWGYDPSGNKMKKDYNQQLSLLSKIEEIKRQLNNVVRDREGLKPFLEQYDLVAHLVSPFADNIALERQILTPEAKAEMISASSEELERVASSLKEIGELQSFIDAPEFRGLEKLFPLITPIESAHIDQAAKSNEVSTRITQLLDRYNRIVNTLSEIFIAWDHMLTTIDVHISALERKARQ
uniref:Dynactin subunit 3 n=1 Tax=Anthurium amnicola TaxID=1678845 RepID=A0A1D1ZC04_9ARAE